MNAAAMVLIITLAHGGFWYGDGDSANRAAWEWNLPAARVPAAELQWKLFFGTLELDHGTIDLPAGKAAGGVDVKLPEFRVRSSLTLHVELYDKEMKKLLQSSDLAIQGMPRAGLKDSARRYAGKKVVLVDRDEALSKLLHGDGEKTVIEHRRVGSISDSEWTVPDLLIVGQEMLPTGAAASAVGATNIAGQQELLDRARAGASVIILAQAAPGDAAGYTIASRAVRAPLAVVEAHPLLQGFTRDQFQEWAGQSARDGTIAAIELPANEAAQELLYWPAESDARHPAPLDALLVTRTMTGGVKPGRIVYVQLSMRDWQEDPRVAMMLANLLDYCATRPQPTVAPADRAPATRPAEKHDNILTGDPR